MRKVGGGGLGGNGKVSKHQEKGETGGEEGRTEGREK